MGYYDDIAEGYDSLHFEEQKKKLIIISNELQIKPYEKLLDVGCGTGFSKKFFSCDWTGIDPAKKLVEKAGNGAVIGCAEDLPFKDHFFDHVISVTAIHNFSDIKKGLLEMRRVGKDSFAFSILKKSSALADIKILISSLFCVQKIITEENDMIFIASSIKNEVE